MIETTRNFFRELKDRKVRRTLAIYLSSALTTIGVLKLITETYQLATNIFPIVVTFLLCGLGSALVFGWYHGKEGVQKFTAKEIALHGALLILALFFSWRVGGSARPALLAPNAKVVAVLPFKNLTGGQEDEYFSDGITEDILTQLSKIGDLRVISRTSIMKYKNSERTIREIGEALGAGTILEGSVRRIGVRVRIAGKLIDARNDQDLWAETYDREMTDIFAIQSEVAQNIAASLKATLSPEERKRIEKPTTQSIDAYGFYLKGREYYYRYTRDDNERAIELFSKALALDSTYALAYAGLGDAYAQRVEKHGFVQAWLDSSAQMSRRAIVLDPNLPEAFKALGVVYFVRGKFHAAQEQYSLAVQLNPNYAAAVSNLGSIYWWTGQFDEALPLFKRNVQLSPTRASAYRNVGIAYVGLGEDSTAACWFRNALELQRDLPIAHSDLIRLYLSQSKIDSARNLAHHALSLLPKDVRILSAAGQVEVFAGRYAKAQEYFAQSQADSADMVWVFLEGGKKEAAMRIYETVVKRATELNGQSEEFTSAYDLARVHATVGKQEEALDWLQQAINRGWRYFRWTSLDPLLKNIRETARFKAMMETMKATVHEMNGRVRAQELR